MFLILGFWRRRRRNNVKYVFSSTVADSHDHVHWLVPAYRGRCTAAIGWMPFLPPPMTHTGTSGSWTRPSPQPLSHGCCPNQWVKIRPVKWHVFQSSDHPLRNSCGAALMDRTRCTHTHTPPGDVTPQYHHHWGVDAASCGKSVSEGVCRWCSRHQTVPSGMKRRAASVRHESGTDSQPEVEPGTSTRSPCKLQSGHRPA